MASPLDNGRPLKGCGVALIALTLIANLVADGGEENPAPNAQAVHDDDPFIQHVAPILAANCLHCHDEDEPEGDFSIATPDDLEAAEFVIPGDAEASYLVDLISPHEGELPVMPLEGQPLSTDEISIIRDWIDSGASWPDGFRVTSTRIRDLNWWSLQPLSAKPPLPSLSELLNDSLDTRQPMADWCRNPIDHFIAQALLGHGIAPSREASRRELIRRVTYDLTGLPPTPEQVRAFENDPDPFAYERLVDRLLASPRYGERWARHWLDVVHYADTHGYDKDKPRPNAWPYRDYVIRSLNEDKSYREFVTEQIAGDAVEPRSPDRIVATGFLSAGPWDFIGHAEVPETKRDGRIARNLDRDDMVTTTLNAFCSLTVQCARCHHHKLDPVAMDDYYRLQAVFASLDRADRKYDPDPIVAAQRADFETQIARQVDALANLNDRIRESSSEETQDLKFEIQRLEHLESGGERQIDTTLPRSVFYGYHSQIATESDTPKWVQIDLGRVVTIDLVALWAAAEWGWTDFGFPNELSLEFANDPNFENVIDSQHLADVRPGASPWVVHIDGLAARYVRITATQLWNRRHRDAAGESGPLTDDWIFALGELMVLGPDGRLPIFDVTALDSIEAPPRWGLSNLIDGVTGTHSLDVLTTETTVSPTNGYHSVFSEVVDTTKWIQVDLSDVWLTLGDDSAALQSIPRIHAIELVPAFPTDWQDTPGFGFPARFRIEVSDSEDFEESVTWIEATGDEFAALGNRTVRFEAPPDLPHHPRFVRITATRLGTREPGMHMLALAEVRILAGGMNVALGADATALDSIEQGRWSTTALTDGHSSRVDSNRLDELIETLTRDSFDSDRLATLRETYFEALENEVGTELLQLRDRLQGTITTLQSQRDALPAQHDVYVATVHHGSGTFRGRSGLGPRPIHILRRGDVDALGEVVQPGTVPLYGDESLDFELPTENTEAAGRLALAEWIVEDRHPLTWRSIVNRIWQYHFGIGLVETPNDFGRGGSSPSHEDLLTWLAIEFRDQDASIKNLHRIICLSATYRQSVRYQPIFAGEIDPRRVDQDNRLLWRFNRRRLTAEEIRDSMLTLTDVIDLRMGGPGFQDFVIEFPEHSPHYEYGLYDLDDRSTHRRTVYRFIVRSQPQPLMTALDCADPSISVPRRDETLTAIGALAMMNNRFVTDMAERFAVRLERDAETLEEQLALGFRLVTTREPSEPELRSLTSYAQEHGLSHGCRVLLNLNEFVFLD